MVVNRSPAEAEPTPAAKAMAVAVRIDLVSMIYLPLFLTGKPGLGQARITESLRIAPPVVSLARDGRRAPELGSAQRTEWSQVEDGGDTDHWGRKRLLDG